MFRVMKDNEVLATLHAVTWVKRQDNGSFGITDRASAHGVVLDGKVYHVAGLPEIEGVDTVAVGEISEVAYQQEQAAALNDATLPASIAFVVLSEAGQIDDVTITENASQFSPWVEGVSYAEGAIRRDTEDGNLYRCIQPHTSQADWSPHITPALWKKIGDPAEEWPEWSAPLGAHDAYAKGDKVSHNGKHWVSDYDANTWEPGHFGWTEVTEGE